MGADGSGSPDRRRAGRVRRVPRRFPRPSLLALRSHDPFPTAVLPGTGRGGDAAGTPVPVPLDAALRPLRPGQFRSGAAALHRHGPDDGPRRRARVARDAGQRAHGQPALRRGDRRHSGIRPGLGRAGGDQRALARGSVRPARRLRLLAHLSAGRQLRHRAPEQGQAGARRDRVRRPGRGPVRGRGVPHRPRGLHPGGHTSSAPRLGPLHGAAQRSARGPARTVGGDQDARPPPGGTSTPRGGRMPFRP